MEKRITIALSIVFLTTGAFATDWPQYFGPTRDAKSAETGLARSWPDGGPKTLWTLPLGEGFGGPVVSAGQVYVLDRVDSARDVLRRVDLATGKQVWEFVYDAPGKTMFNGSRSAPTVEGDRVYTCGAFGHLNRVDTKTGKPVWSKNIWTDFGGEKVPLWAIGQNPLIHGDLLILFSQAPEAGVVAYDKKTGDLRWKTPKLPGRFPYVSPTVATIAGQEQLVVVSSGLKAPGPSRMGATRGRARSTEPPVKGVIVGLDPASGEQLWSYDGWQCVIPVPNVTAIGDGRLFVTGGYRAGSAMFKVARKGGAFAVEELFKTADFGTHVHPAMLIGDHLYAHCTDNAGRRDGMTCMDLDGAVKWKTGTDPVFDKGGFILADGMMISIDGKEGVLYLIDPNPEGFKKLASAKVLDTDKCWAPLALSDGKLVIRDQKQMKCLDLR